MAVASEPVMAVHRWAELDDAERTRLLDRATGRMFDPELRESVARIVEESHRLLVPAGLG